MVYLDWNATTPVSDEVTALVMRLMREDFGNASSRHAAGRGPAEAVRVARGQVADLLGCRASHLFFTSGATESVNTVIKALARPGGHIVTQRTEHAAVTESCEAVAAAGTRITTLAVSRDGLCRPDAVAEAIAGGADLVTIMWANNETGAIQPIEEIAAVCRRAGVPLHSDATQAVGKIAVSAETVDYLSLSGHKFGGPKGAGGLFVRGRRPPAPLLHGGGQEGGVRGGTLNVPAIAGMGLAATEVAAVVADRPRIAARRDRFETTLSQGLSAAGTPVQFFSRSVDRLPNTSYFAAKGLNAESLVKRLGDIVVSSGAACSMTRTEPSRTLRAMAVDAADLAAAVRVSIGPTTTDADLTAAAERIIEAAHWTRFLTAG